MGILDYYEDIHPSIRPMSILLESGFHIREASKKKVETLEETL